MASFNAFNLSKPLVEALRKEGYLEASPIQQNIIPRALRGESLICQSPTGSGKTHAYLIPIIEKIDINLPRLQALIICPSRELARQVFEFTKQIAKHFPKLKFRLLSSEAEKADNQEGLSLSPHLVIGTPGRLKDLLVEDYALDLRGVKSLVIDEADMLMEMGYFEDVDEIYSKLTSEPQVMVFSATLHEGLKEQLRRYIHSDFTFEGGEEKTSANVSHHLLNIKHIGTNEALKEFLRIKNPYLCLVFASKKEDVKKIYNDLKASNFNVGFFSGDLDTRERKQTLRMIRLNKYQVIVCSDLLSRGIDIEDVSDVVSIDLPNDSSYYYHRAGRTGRFDKKGDSYVFYNADYTRKPKELIEQGVPFDYLILKKDEIVADPVGLAEKKKFTKKKAFDNPDEAKEIKIAKAKSRVKHVEPGYKKKQAYAIERVKNKYRRKAIQKSVNMIKSKKYRAEAKKAIGE